MRFISIVYFVATIKCSISFRSRFSQSYKDKYLVGHVIRRVAGVDWLQCVTECSKDGRCVAYNYRANGGLCELNDLSVNCGENIGNLRIETGMFYHQLEKRQAECHRTEDGGCPNDCHLATEYSTELGESPDHPADSCHSIYVHRSSPPPNGVYYIKTINTRKKYTRVYCHMDMLSECGGEGWTLVMKIDGRKNTFRYEATAYWMKQHSFNECACRDLEPNECKSPTFWSTEIKKGYCLGMRYNGTTSWMRFNNNQRRGDPTLLDKMNALPVSSPVSSTPEETIRRWKKLLAGSVLESGCNVIEGVKIALPSGSSITRIGVFAACNKRPSWIGFGLSERFPGLNESITCGNVASDRLPVRAMGYIFIQ